MISVIVPVYNVESYLNECLQSIVSQTCNDFEIILVDDGSHDNSGEICESWAKKYQFISVIHKENGGLSSARNVGLETAQGDYISFVDSDDVIDSTMLSRMRSVLDEYSNVSFVTCYLETFVDGSEKSCNFLPIPSQGMISTAEYLRQVLRHKADNAVCNKMFRASTIGDLRFVSGKVNEDILFLTSFLERNREQIYVIPEGLYKYRLRPGSITQHANPKMFDFIENAFKVKEIVKTIYGETLISEADAYIYHEMINFISNVNKYSARDLFNDKIRICIRYLYDNKLDFVKNKNCSLFHKVKLLFVLFMPRIYRCILKYK